MKKLTAILTVIVLLCTLGVTVNAAGYHHANRSYSYCDSDKVCGENCRNGKTCPKNGVCPKNDGTCQNGENCQISVTCRNCGQPKGENHTCVNTARNHTSGGHHGGHH